MSRATAPLLAALAFALAAGCAPRVVHVGALDVAPARALPQPDGRLILALTPATPDEIRIRVSGFPSVEVRAFRATLQRAFERAFPPAQARRGSPLPESTLHIQVSEVDFVTDRHEHAWRDGSSPDGDAEIVLAHGTVPDTQVRPMRRQVRYAQLHFTASLRERGAVVARLTGRATAVEPTIGSADSVASSLRSAIAVLYQRIAAEFFRPRTARSGSRAPGSRRAHPRRLE